MKKFSLVLILTFAAVSITFAGGAAESASSAGRGRYLAGQGIIVPPEEIYTDSYIASVPYGYPEPDAPLGVTLYSSNNLVSVEGQDMILHIGIQGMKSEYDALPPMNLVYVIDTSGSMNDQDKIEWVKDGFDIFLEKVRDKDFVSLVTFSDTARVVFPSMRMDTREKRDRLKQAVRAIRPEGGSDLEKGLTTGYEQILANYREDYINRVLFLSDGTEFSSRLNLAGAQTGDIRVSLIWDNSNDLDLHVVTPRGEEIYYGHKTSLDGGFLDVDANAGSPFTNKPVENVFWADGTAMAGTYRVFVRNYDYHTVPKEESNFRLQIKNGDELSYFEGTTSRLEKDYEITEFVFKTGGALKREKALIYELASSYRAMGINITTIGVGVGFDMQMMTQLAKEGGGSSRFISDKTEMEKIFGSEFDRMAVPVARDVEMTLRLFEGVTPLETWGYGNKVFADRVEYNQPTLHLGDYETILVKYRVPKLPPGKTIRIAEFSAVYTDALGKRSSTGPVTVDIVVSDSEVPVTGISNGMVLRSGTIMMYAETLKEIGGIYYRAVEAAGNSGEPDPGQLENALDLTMALKKQILNAKMRLDDESSFVEEIELLDRYIEIIGEDIGADGVTVAGYKDSVEIDPVATIRSLSQRVGDLCSEIILGFEPEERMPVALSGFTSRDGKAYPLLAVLDETAAMMFARQSSVNLVERKRILEVIEEQKLSLTGLMDTGTAIEVGKLLSARYIITGTVIPMQNSVVIFGRLIDVESGEIINAAQTIMSRDDVGDLLDL